MATKRVSRRSFILGSIAVLSYLYFDLYSIAITRYTISIHNLPTEFDGFTILHLTDLHCKEVGKDQRSLIEIINTQHFDIIAITGDVVSRENHDVQPIVSLVKGLHSKPIFFVYGNHDCDANYIIKSPLRDQGVHILNNTHYKYTKNNSHIWLLGVNDPATKRDNLNQALKGVQNDTAPKILLAHAPEIYAKGIRDNIDIILVGHTHGGQIRLPLIGALIAPGQGYFPKYDYGQFNTDNTTMIINSGLGESVLPIRFYNRPEIVLITLTTPK